VVTDHGAPVYGLKRSNFHLFEDGKERTITAFDEHIAPARSAAQPVASFPPGTYTNMRSGPSATALNVILLDTLNTPFDAQANAEAQLKQFLASAQPGVPTAIFKLDGNLRLIAGFSTDPQEQLRTVRLANMKPQHSKLSDQEGDKRRAATIASTPVEATKNAPGLIESLKEMDASLNTARDHNRLTLTLDAFARLARILSNTPGRKNLIWISGSFPFSLKPYTTMEEPVEDLKDFANEFNRTIRQLAIARVAVYPIDARGLSGLPSADATDHYNAASGYVDRFLVPHAQGESGDMNFLAHSSDERSTMRQIASATGGTPFVNTNAIAGSIASAEQDGANYYSLGYVPAEKDLDGKFHTIKVKIDGALYHLAYRNGFLAGTKDAANANAQQVIPPILASLMLGAPPVTQIGIAARIAPATQTDARKIMKEVKASGAHLALPGGSGQQAYLATIIIDPRSVAFARDKSGAHTSMLEVALIVFDRDGIPIEDVEHHAELRIPDKVFAPALRQGVSVSLPLSLPDGFSFIRIAVHDPVTNRIGSLEIPVSVPAKQS
jgi:VWFA-related protein